MLQAIAKCAAESLKEMREESDEIISEEELIAIEEEANERAVRIIEGLEVCEYYVIEGEIRSALNAADQEIVEEKEQSMLLGDSFAAEVLGDTAEDVDNEVQLAVYDGLA